MKSLSANVVGYKILNHMETVEVANEAGEVVQTVQKRVVTGTREVTLSSGRKVDAVFSVNLENGQFGVQVNVPSLRNMTAAEWQEHGAILQEVQAKGNEVKTNLEAQL